MRLTTEEILDRIKRINVIGAASTDNVIAAPGSGRKIVIVGLWLTAHAANQIQFLAGATFAGGVAINAMPAIKLLDAGGIVMMPFLPIAELPDNTAMSFTVGTPGNLVFGGLHYVIAPV